jgi:opacity protein-like surface antigen
MQFTRWFVAACAAVTAMICPAKADSPWYVTGSVGAYFREDTQFSATAVGDPGITGNGVRSYDPGLLLALGVGYRLPHGFRVETEFSYIHLTVAKTVYGSPFNVTRHYVGPTDDTHYVGTLDLYYDLPFSGPVIPYLGDGIGGAHEESTSATAVDQTGRSLHFAGGESTRGVGLIDAGLNINLTDDLTLVPSYCWMRFFGGEGTNATEAAHIGKISLRYSF